MFKEKKDSYPSELTSEKWNEILDQMIEGFAYYLKDKYEYTNHEKIDNALELFAKWFHHLWW
jgi:hypothetical protein